jgi:hypothetical protein
MKKPKPITPLEIARRLTLICMARDRQFTRMEEAGVHVEPEGEEPTHLIFDILGVPAESKTYCRDHFYDIYYIAALEHDDPDRFLDFVTGKRTIKYPKGGLNERQFAKAVMA